ncbi:MAG: hypothetical protein IGS03_07185, partial [Candidatus Sericytochromatia bacterium]|nr:hypothetical protein [Candidatus Sericytochromatia bacterium]
MLNFEQLNFSAVYLTPGLPAAGINPPLENTGEPTPSFAQYLLAQGESSPALRSPSFSSSPKKSVFQSNFIPLPALRLAERLSGFVKPAALSSRTHLIADKAVLFDPVQLLWSSAAQPLTPFFAGQPALDALNLNAATATAYNNMLFGEWPALTALPVVVSESEATPAAPAAPVVAAPASEATPAAPSAPAVVVSGSDVPSVAPAAPAAPAVVVSEADA